MEINRIRHSWKGIVIASLIGSMAVSIERFTQWTVLDPLVVALIIGAAIRSFVKFDDVTISGFALTPSVFIPVGVIFYGAANLNFAKFAKVDPSDIFILLIAFVMYVISALSLASLFNLKEKVSYLIATGSAVCGASAIVITSKAIDAEPDDISNSLLPVFLSALIGLFILIPMAVSYFRISELEYGVLCGAILQFTGFVKTAVVNSPDVVKNVALSIKAVRYMGLLFFIPLFASFVKGKFYIPWYLWAFLGSGIMFSFMPNIAAIMRPTLKLILNVLWSVAMGAIGLNVNIKTLFTRTGFKAFVVSFISMIVAMGVYLIGLYLKG